MPTPKQVRDHHCMQIRTALSALCELTADEWEELIKYDCNAQYNLTIGRNVITRVAQQLEALRVLKRESKGPTNTGDMPI